MSSWETTPFSEDKDDAYTVMFAEHHEVPEKMRELVKKCGKSTGDPLKDAATLYGEFIEIHPFDDGNGRTGRALINFVLMKNNLLPIHAKSASLDGYTLAQCSVDYQHSKNPVGMASLLANAQIQQMKKALDKYGIEYDENIDTASHKNPIRGFFERFH
jgi:Fic family protein